MRLKQWERQEPGDDNLWCEVLQNFAQIVVDESLCRDDNLWCNILVLFRMLVNLSTRLSYSKLFVNSKIKHCSLIRIFVVLL